LSIFKRNELQKYELFQKYASKIIY
jgi:hypothetical protein